MSEYVQLFNSPSGILVGHLWLWFAAVFMVYYLQIHNRVFYNRSGLLTNIWTIYLVTQVIQCIISMLRINDYPGSTFLGACLLCTLSLCIHIQALVFNVFYIACTTQMSSLLDSKWIGAESYKNKRLYYIYASSYIFYLIIVFSIPSLIKIAVFGVALVYYSLVLICSAIIYKKLQMDPKNYAALSIDRETTEYTLTDEKIRLMYNFTVFAMTIGIGTIWSFCMFFYMFIYIIVHSTV